MEIDERELFCTKETRSIDDSSVFNLAKNERLQLRILYK